MQFFKRYPSGLRLVAEQIEHYHTVSLGVFVDVGCVRETTQTNGYAHFIEHLVFKGTQRRTCLQISEEIDDLGANINAYTAKDATCFYTKSSSDDLAVCMDILSDMYFNATIPQDELEREKGVVIEEIKMCEDAPDDVCQDLSSAALFYKQKMGQTILGNAKNIKYSDRHSLLDFKKRFYIPASTVVAVCGNFDWAQLTDLVQQYFEDHCEQTSCKLPDEPAVNYGAEFLYSFKPIEQSHIQLAWGGCALGSYDRFALSMLASILGGGLSSRLNQEIREKNGLAYSVYAYPSYYSNCGAFEIYVGLSPDNCARVCDLIESEINKLLSNGITERELLRARTQAVNALYMNSESNMTLMRLYGRSMLKLNEVFVLQDDIAAYNAVTAQQIDLLAHKLFAQKHASAYVGPQVKDYDLVSKIR